MTAAVDVLTEEFVEVAGHRVQVRRAGQGAPVLVLHGELWIPGATVALTELAGSYEVIVPSLPGFGQSEIPEWVMSLDDLANWVVEFVESQALAQPVTVVGFSLGAWVATLVAAVNRRMFDKMVLVNPIGVKPEEGDIWDYNRYSAKESFALAVNDHSAADYEKYYAATWTPEETEQIEVNRDIACRLTWKPYMWSYTTKWRAELVKTPTLIIVGGDDKIVPNNVGGVLNRAIAGSQFTVIEGGGHLVEIDRPSEVADAIKAFLG